METPMTRSSMPTLEEYVDEIKDIWDSHWLTNIELLTNGHMAIELGL